MEEARHVSTPCGEVAESAQNTSATTPATSKGNIFSQLQELPSNVSSARVFKLPPGVIFVNPSTGQLVSGAAPPPLILKTAEKKCTTEPIVAIKDENTKEIVPSSTAQKTQPIYKIIEHVVLPTSAESSGSKQKLLEMNAPPATAVKPRIITLPRPHSSTSTTNKPRIITLHRHSSSSTADKPRIITLSRPHSLTVNPARVVSPRSLLTVNRRQIFPEVQIDIEPPPLVKIEPRSPITRDDNTTEPELIPKPKPKPWSIPPRPLFRSKEPVVMYSGCKPEDLEKERKRKTREKEKRPESLPCPEKLEKILPKSYKYHISSFEELKNPDHFKAEVRVNLSKKEDALQWLQDFELMSGTNFRIRKTFKENSSRIIFKKCFKCFRNTYRKDQVRVKESKRHVGCQAKLGLTIKNPEMKSSADPLLSDFPCVILIYHNHCHSLTNSETLCRRRPLPEVREKFADMFRAHVTPATALRVHKADLKREYGDKYTEVIVDGARCPLLPWCYRLYYEICGKKVKDGKKKSLRSLRYASKRKKLAMERSNAPKQALRDNAAVIANLNPGDCVSDSFTVANMNEGQAEEVQRSINSLYEYEYIEKSNLDRENDTAGDDEISKGENSNALVNNGDVIIYNEAEVVQGESADEEYIDDGEILTHDGSVEYGDNVECVAYEDNAECIIYEDNGECVTYDESGDCITYEESGDCVMYENDGEGEVYEDNGKGVAYEDESEIAANIEDSNEDPPQVEDTEASSSASCSVQFHTHDVEELTQKLGDVFNHISMKLSTQPDVYFPIVRKFTVGFQHSSETGSDSDLVAALLNFGSELSRAQKQSGAEASLVNDELSTQRKRPLSVTGVSPESFGNTKRKVLVLRMDPNKFNQIIGKVDEKKLRKQISNELTHQT